MPATWGWAPPGGPAQPQPPSHCRSRNETRGLSVTLLFSAVCPRTKCWKLQFCPLPYSSLPATAAALPDLGTSGWGGVEGWGRAKPHQLPAQKLRSKPHFAKEGGQPVAPAPQSLCPNHTDGLAPARGPVLVSWLSKLPSFKKQRKKP